MKKEDNGDGDDDENIISYIYGSHIFIVILNLNFKNHNPIISP